MALWNDLCRSTLRRIIENPETDEETKILAIEQLIKLIELKASLLIEV